MSFFLFPIPSNWQSVHRPFQAHSCHAAITFVYYIVRRHLKSWQPLDSFWRTGDSLTVIHWVLKATGELAERSRQKTSGLIPENGINYCILGCFWRAGRTAIAPVLKTGGRKPLGVRIPRSPQFSFNALHRNNIPNAHLDECP